MPASSLCLCLSAQKSQPLLGLDRAHSQMLSEGLPRALHNLSLCDVHGGSTSLCLRCGKPGAQQTCHSGCQIARFCSRQCEQAAMSSHRGACSTARDVKGRAAHEPSPEEQEKLQTLLGMVGRHLNPLLSNQAQADCVLHFLRQHPEIMQQRLADYLFLSCEKLHRDRVCCNPHIYSWCLLDGCLRTGDVRAFAQSVGLSANEAPDSSLSAEQSRQRFTDWQRATALPMQEMFGQVGMGRFWEEEPASLAEAGQSRSLESRGRRSINVRDSASSFPPARTSIDFRGTPTVLAVRPGMETHVRSGVSSSGVRDAATRAHASTASPSASRAIPCQPPLSRSNSMQPDFLV